MAKLTAYLSLMVVTLAMLACGGGLADRPGPTADSIPVAAECSMANPGEAAFGDDPVSISTATNRGPFCYSVAANTEITIRWDGALKDTTRVRFYRSSPEMDFIEVLGTDEDASDGFAMMVTFDTDMPPSTLYAGSVDDTGHGDESDRIAIFIEE